MFLKLYSCSSLTYFETIEIIKRQYTFILYQRKYAQAIEFTLKGSPMFHPFSQVESQHLCLPKLWLRIAEGYEGLGRAIKHVIQAVSKVLLGGLPRIKDHLIATPQSAIICHYFDTGGLGT